LPDEFGLLINKEATLFYLDREPRLESRVRQLSAERLRGQNAAPLMVI